MIRINPYEIMLLIEPDVPEERHRDGPLGVPHRQAVGRDAHVANERRVLSRAKPLMSRCVRPVFVSGDKVVIRWIFRFEWLDGTVTRMEELAYQRWEGERIAEEIFFYDPAQLIPRKMHE